MVTGSSGDLAPDLIPQQVVRLRKIHFIYLDCFFSTWQVIDQVKRSIKTFALMTKEFLMVVACGGCLLLVQVLMGLV